MGLNSKRKELDLSVSLMFDITRLLKRYFFKFSENPLTSCKIKSFFVEPIQYALSFFKADTLKDMGLLHFLNPYGH